MSANQRKGLEKRVLLALVLVLGALVFLKVYNKKDSSNINSNSKKVCTFQKVEMKAYQIGTDVLLTNKEIRSCFESKVVDQSLGLVEITNDDKSFKVSYYIEKNPNILRFLNVKIDNNEPVMWRANLGHDLFVEQNESSLSFIFGDTKKSKIKGTIKFVK